VYFLRFDLLCLVVFRVSRMGEAVLSGGEGMELDKKDGAGEVVRWERLRVLLVEADYSTRQIIAALLRKCSYRGQFLWL
jgi:hypothetical protein